MLLLIGELKFGNGRFPKVFLLILLKHHLIKSISTHLQHLHVERGMLFPQRVELEEMHKAAVGLIFLKMRRGQAREKRFA